MGASGQVGKAEGERYVFGPRALGAVLPRVLRPAFRRRSPGVAHLAEDWPAVVGPALAAVTAPKKLFSGTLAIAASGPVALELQHLSGQLMERINRHLGRIAVTRLRFVQDFSPALLAPKVTPPPTADAAAARAVQNLPEGPLREALQRLGRVVLARAGDA
jgi:hypothetical protein